MRVLAAACVYFVLAFGAGFALAVPRTFLLEPRLGAFASTLVEAPIMLALCWFAAGFAVRRFAPGAPLSGAVAIGALWLALLLAAEFATGLWARGLAPEEALAVFLTPQGLVGLGSQLICAAFPVLRRCAVAQTPWLTREQGHKEGQ